MSFDILSKRYSPLDFERENEILKTLMSNSVLSGMEVTQGSDATKITIGPGKFLVGGVPVKENAVRQDELVLTESNGRYIVWVEYDKSGDLPPEYRTRFEPINIPADPGLIPEFVSPELTPEEKESSVILADIIVGDLNLGEVIIRNRTTKATNRKVGFANPANIMVSSSATSIDIYLSNLTFYVFDNLLDAGFVDPLNVTGDLVEVIPNSEETLVGPDPSLSSVINIEVDHPDRSHFLFIKITGTYSCEMIAIEALGSIFDPSADIPEDYILVGYIGWDLDNRHCYLYGMGSFLCDTIISDRVPFPHKIESPTYGTSTVKPHRGSLNIDEVITNIDKLKSATLDTLYNGLAHDAGHGDGRKINAYAGPVEIESTLGGGQLALNKSVLEYEIEGTTSEILDFLDEEAGGLANIPSLFVFDGEARILKVTNSPSASQKLSQRSINALTIASYKDSTSGEVVLLRDMYHDVEYDGDEIIIQNLGQQIENAVKDLTGYFKDDDHSVFTALKGGMMLFLSDGPGEDIDPGRCFPIKDAPFLNLGENVTINKRFAHAISGIQPLVPFLISRYITVLFPVFYTTGQGINTSNLTVAGRASLGMQPSLSSYTKAIIPIDVTSAEVIPDGGNFPIELVRDPTDEDLWASVKTELPITGKHRFLFKGTVKPGFRVQEFMVGFKLESDSQQLPDTEWSVGVDFRVMEPGTNMVIHKGYNSHLYTVGESFNEDIVDNMDNLMPGGPFFDNGGIFQLILEFDVGSGDFLGTLDLTISQLSLVCSYRSLLR